jgi:hypothetical protein
MTAETIENAGLFGEADPNGQRGSALFRRSGILSGVAERPEQSNTAERLGGHLSWIDSRLLSADNNTTFHVVWDGGLPKDLAYQRVADEAGETKYHRLITNWKSKDQYTGQLLFTSAEYRVMPDGQIGYAEKSVPLTPDNTPERTADLPPVVLRREGLDFLTGDPQELSRPAELTEGMTYIPPKPGEARIGVRDATISPYHQEQLMFLLEGIDPGSLMQYYPQIAA